MALMLLEATTFHHPNIRMKTFKYRAWNPVVVNKVLTVHGAWENKSTINVWCMDNDEIIGMSGQIWV
jgi:hydroxyacyl-ACP dehydratase HTD2-like protein with hotdog domain